MDYNISRNICLSLLLISVIIGSFSSCQKEDIEMFSNTPLIELVSVSSDTITQFEETLVITIKYKDGDGDLGFEETDQYALFIRDIRLEEFDGFYLGPILPPNEMAPITGELDVEFPNLFVFSNSDTETTRFEIKMVDRAMNESNVLVTEDILIEKP